MSRIRRLAAIPVVVAAMVAGVLISATPAQADVPATVGNTDGDGLRVRQAPFLSSAQVGSVQTGDVIQIACQAFGDEVTNSYGFTSDLWDYSTALGGYVADAYMATGHDGRIPGVPECDDTAPPTNDITPIQQNQGQTTQWEDCGPTSVVTALLSQGITPHGWNVSVVESIHRAREDMGLQRNVLTGGTNESQVVQAFATYGINATVSWDFDAILAHVRAGGSVVLAGNTRGVNWPVNVKDPATGVPHFLMVGGYDASTGRYLVADPIAIENTVKHTTSTILYAYFDNYLGRAGVLI